MSFAWDLFNLQDRDTQRLIYSQVFGTPFVLDIHKKNRKNRKNRKKKGVPMTNDIFNTDKWIEVKDAPIRNIKTLMRFIDAYRSPQSKMDAREFLDATQSLIEKYLSSEISKSSFSPSLLDEIKEKEYNRGYDDSKKGKQKMFKM